MAAINKENDIKEITKKLHDMPQLEDDGVSSCPPSPSRNIIPQMSDLRARHMAEEMVLKFRRAAEDAYSEYDGYIYNIRNTLSAPIIIAMKGDQATGRKLVAFYLASILRCPLIKEHDFDNCEETSEENQAKLWRNICSLALTQLTSGRCVVIDTKLANENEFDQLKELSQKTKTPLAIFESRIKSGDVLMHSSTMQLYDTIDPVFPIFDEFVEKPISKYINPTNFNMGEIPRIVVKKQGHEDISRSVCNSLIDVLALIFPSFQSQPNTDCDHDFMFTNIEDEYKRPCCQCRQLVSGSVYLCQQCPVMFHQTCSYFPESLWMSDRLATLYIQYVNLELDADARCSCCKQLIKNSTCSRYYSDGRNLFDLECLFLLPPKLTAKFHEHELVQIFCDPQARCTECDAMIYEGTLCYLCLECSALLDVYCLWLPETVQSSRDRHPLKLSVVPALDSDPYYCHGCEEERDTNKWIYYCEDCDFQTHPRCIVKAPCLPRFLSTEISTTNKKSNEKLTETECHSSSSILSTEQELPSRIRSEAEELGVLFKESTEEIKLPIIITTKGHSTGRKLVASTLAATFDCLLIDKDTLCKVTHTVNKPILVSYQEITQIALSQLQIGLSVVIDCDLSQESEFIIIRDFAFATKTPLFVVEFKPCDENRTQDFHRIIRSVYDYDVGDTPKISIDVNAPTFDSIDKSVPHILHYISDYIKELSKEHTQKLKIRSCYRHALAWQKKDGVLEGDICNGCSKQLLNPFLQCKGCRHVLHRECTKLPLLIEVYNLTLRLEKYGNDKVRCNCCNEFVKDYAYIYSEDQDDIFICLDLNCLLTPPKPGKIPHEHPLDLTFSVHPFQCRGCGSTRKHILMYSCNGCRFNIGVRCGWLKETVTFDRHRHPFQLIVSPEHASNQYYCEVCGEERDKDHWVYCCIECDYFIHVRCIGLPETAYCPPSEYYDDEDDAFSVQRTHLLDVAESAPVLPSAELLEWPKKDNHRFLHVVYRVGDLDRTIKFYTECFGMKLLRKRDFSKNRYSNALLGFGSEETNFAVELKCNYGVKKYDIGTGFGHFAIATPDVYKLAKTIKAKGGNISREPGPVKGESSVFAFAKDPDGYIFKLIQRDATPESLCQIMLRVGNLDGAIIFYEKALGMKMLSKIDRPEHKYTLAMMGYAEESETTVLELTYNYGVTEYTKGNAYKQIAISTQDVYKSGEVVNFVTQELGGKVTRQPGSLHEINTKITAFLDPDGWKTILVDNEYFLKELEKEQSRQKQDDVVNPFEFYDDDSDE